MKATAALNIIIAIALVTDPVKYATAATVAPATKESSLAVLTDCWDIEPDPF